MADNRDKVKEMGEGGLVIPVAGNINGGGGLRVDQGLHFKEAEHSRVLYCDVANSGPLQEDVAEARGLVCMEVVGTRGA